MALATRERSRYRDPARRTATAKASPEGFVELADEYDRANSETHEREHKPG